MVRVKICGITNLEDALTAVEAGADALGFVFHEPSPRNVSPQKAAAIIAKLPPFVQSVGLFVDADVERVNWTADFCGLDLIHHGRQPSGSEYQPPAPCGQRSHLLVDGADLHPLLVGEQRYVDRAGDVVLRILQRSPSIYEQVAGQQIRRE